MKPHRKRQIAFQAAALVVGYPLAVVGLMRWVTAYVESPWIVGFIFLAFTFFFWRLVTGVKTKRILGRRW